MSVKAEGFPASVELSSLDGSNGLILNGIAEGGQSPLNAASAGDINRDGIDDLLIGAPNADVNGTTDADQAYVVFGTDQGFPNTLELSALDGTNGFVLNGIAQGDFSGISVSPAEDVNGDTFGDLIIGANGVDRNGLFNVGQAYVVFGTEQGFPAVLELSELNGTNGFIVNGDIPSLRVRSARGITANLTQGSCMIQKVVDSYRRFWIRSLGKQWTRNA